MICSSSHGPVSTLTTPTKVYEARLAALLAARNDRKDEHKRAQERYKKVRSRVALLKLFAVLDRARSCVARCVASEVGYRYSLRSVCQAGLPRYFVFVVKPRQDCEEFDKKVEKLQGEKERRMEECLDELRGLEDGYRQKQRDAKQVTSRAPKGRHE